MGFSTLLFPAGSYQATMNRQKVKGWTGQLQLLPCLSSRVLCDVRSCLLQTHPGTEDPL